MGNLLEKAKNIHFIGIGGIGISAIAKMLKNEGKRVSGSDSTESVITQKLKNEGIDIKIGHKKENVPKDTDLIIYTIAVTQNNPELFYAKSKKINTITYPEALGEISKNKYTIAISGTHGKTTTTAMTAQIFMENNFSPTVIVGSLLKNNENFIAGKSKYLIVEACEYKRSFLNLSPMVLAITNIDADHLDYYKDIKDIQSAFIELVKKVPKEGAIICDPKGDFMEEVLIHAKSKIINYKNFKIPDNGLSVFGKHNLNNAQVAGSIGEFLNLQNSKILKSLKNFKGTWRRQEYKGKTQGGALVYDDYAHHPREIEALIEAMKEMHPGKKITIIFQPHLFSRTKTFLDDFAKSLSYADNVIITDIYAAREKEDKSINSKLLFEKINNSSKLYAGSFNGIIKNINSWAGENDIIVTVGAGDIYKLSEELVV